MEDFVNTFLRPFWIVLVSVVFTGIVFYAYRPKNKQKLEEHGSIPLRDDDEER